MIPLIFGSKVLVGDPKWCIFLRLVQIQQWCCCPLATAATGHCLKIIILRHNLSFQDAYPESSFITKLHYLLHLPTQIEKYCPCRHQWCMRYEAKNGFLKRSKLRNTKNVPKTIAYSHQLWMSSVQHDSSGILCCQFLNAFPETKPGL